MYCHNSRLFFRGLDANRENRENREINRREKTPVYKECSAYYGHFAPVDTKHRTRGITAVAFQLPAVDRPSQSAFWPT